MTVQLNTADMAALYQHPHAKTNESPASVVKVLKPNGSSASPDKLSKIVKMLSGSTGEEKKSMELGEELKQISSILPAGVVGAFGQRESGSVGPTKKYSDSNLETGELKSLASALPSQLFDALEKKTALTGQESNRGENQATEDLESDLDRSDLSSSGSRCRHRSSSRRRKKGSKLRKTRSKGPDAAESDEMGSSSHQRPSSKRGDKGRRREKGGSPDQLSSSSRHGKSKRRGNEKTKKACSPPRLLGSDQEENGSDSSSREESKRRGADRARRKRNKQVRRVISDCAKESEEKSKTQRGISRALSAPRLNADSKSAVARDGTRRQRGERRSKESAAELSNESRQDATRRHRGRVERSRGGRNGDVRHIRSGGRRAQGGDVCQDQLKQALQNHDAAAAEQEVEEVPEQEATDVKGKEIAPEEVEQPDVSVPSGFFAPAKLAAGFASKAGNRTLNVAGMMGTLAQTAATTAANKTLNAASTAANTTLIAASTAANTTLNVASSTANAAVEAGNNALSVASTTANVAANAVVNTTTSTVLGNNAGLMSTDPDDTLEEMI